MVFSACRNVTRPGYGRIRQNTVTSLSVARFLHPTPAQARSSSSGNRTCTLENHTYTVSPAHTAIAALTTVAVLGQFRTTNAQAQTDPETVLDIIAKGGKVLDFSEHNLSKEQLEAVYAELGKSEKPFIGVVWNTHQHDVGGLKSKIELVLSVSRRVYQGGRVLDLSEFTLTKEHLSKIFRELEQGEHHYVRVEWGTREDCQEVEKINQCIQAKREAFQERPSPRVCARLAGLVYQNADELKKPGMLPEGWEYVQHRDETEKNGYFAVAFKNANTGHMILATRGTHEHFFDWQTNFIGVVGHEVERQQNSAFTFAGEIFTLGAEKGYRVGLVGHSLGGWLSQLCAFYGLSRGVRGIYVVTLDTPGAKRVLRKYKKKLLGLPRVGVNLEQLDFTHYLSLPNIVNCIREQTGDIHHIVPEGVHPFDVSQLALSQYKVVNWGVRKAFNCADYKYPDLKLSTLAKGGTYTLQTHSSSELVNAFDEQSQRPKRDLVADEWPHLRALGGEYYHFLEILHQHQQDLPDKSKLSASDAFLVSKIAKYNPVDADPSEIHLNHFTAEELEWLETVKGLTDEQLQRVSRDYGVDLEALRDFKKCHINATHLKVSKGSASSFREQLGLVLGSYPELRWLSQKLSAHDAQVIRADMMHKFISFCENAILSRLYLFTFPSEEELQKHKQDIAEFQLEIQERKQVLQRVKENQEAVAALKNQIVIFQHLIDISQLQYVYKSRKLDEASILATRLLKSIDASTPVSKYLKGAVLSITAKIARSRWKDGDLEKSAQAYSEACTLLPKVASLRSNYGSLLHNWAESLSWRGESLEVVLQKLEESLEQHRLAFEMSLEPLPDKINPVVIRHDLGKALFLKAEAIFNQSACSRADRDTYRKTLNECLQFFAIPENERSITLESFTGVTYQELARLDILDGLDPKHHFSQAWDCYTQGLEREAESMAFNNKKGEPRHPALLASRAELRRREVDREGEIMGKAHHNVDREKEFNLACLESLEACTYFLYHKPDRKDWTPEDFHRYGLALNILCKLYWGQGDMSLAKEDRAAFPATKALKYLDQVVADVNTELRQQKPS